jgi:hypothetical protein
MILVRLVFLKVVTQSQDREQPPNRVSVQNVDDDDIEDATDINMDEIENEIDVEEIIKEWQMSVPFINRRMNHTCT